MDQLKIDKKVQGLAKLYIDNYLLKNSYLDLEEQGAFGYAAMFLAIEVSIELFRTHSQIMLKLFKLFNRIS